MIPHQTFTFELSRWSSLLTGGFMIRKFLHCVCLTFLRHEKSLRHWNKLAWGMLHSQKFVGACPLQILFVLACRLAEVPITLALCKQTILNFCVGLCALLHMVDPITDGPHRQTLKGLPYALDVFFRCSWSSTPPCIEHCPCLHKFLVP